MGHARLLTATTPRSIDDFVAASGGQGLQRAQRIGSDRILEELAWAGLRGRGGGGFPTARKWQTVRDARGPCTVVCNAAEGEPGTFKDRWLLRHDPWLVLEGVAVAAHAVGASRAFVATKAIFEAENASLERALRELAERDLMGSVPIEIVQGPDAYLYGEEKAMLEVIEGRDPLPRLLPPHQVGLFARPGSPSPTLVNNVETMAHVALIARDGGARFHHHGTPSSRGTMLFTLCGDVRRPGVYEAALGTTLADLVEDAGGGPPEGRTVKAVFPGASAGALRGDALDVPLEFDAMRAAGSGLGSGGFVVYDDSRCIAAATIAFTRFLTDESCAQCPACKRGAGAITEALGTILRGEGTSDDLDTIRSKTRSVTGGARCGLPAGTAAVVGSVLDHFEDELQTHLGQRCEDPWLPTPRLSTSDDEAGFRIVEQVEIPEAAGVT